MAERPPHSDLEMMVTPRTAWAQKSTARRMRALFAMVADRLCGLSSDRTFYTPNGPAYRLRADVSGSGYGPGRVLPSDRRAICRPDPDTSMTETQSRF